MAKAGSREARQISRGQVPDLGLARMSDDQAREMQEVYELKLGMRCSGCGRRIGVGIQFTAIAPRSERMPVIRMAACRREDCDFMEQAKDGAAAMQVVQFVWLDTDGLEARPAKAVERGAVPMAGEGEL